MARHPPRRIGREGFGVVGFVFWRSLGLRSLGVDPAKDPTTHGFICILGVLSFKSGFEGFPVSAVGVVGWVYFRVWGPPNPKPRI